MTIEEELIIEMVKGKISYSRIENIRTLGRLLKEFNDKKSVTEFIYNELNKSFYDDEKHETQIKLNNEVEKLLESANEDAHKGKIEDALNKLSVFMYFPDFFAEMGHAGIDCRNEFEFFSIASNEGHYYQLPIHYSYISGLIGSLFLDLEEYDKAIEFLQNSINWNEWNCNSRFELMEVKMRRFKKENPNKNMPDILLAELRKDLYETYKYVYKPDEFLRYLRKVAYILIEEERYIAARAVFSYAMKMSDDIGQPDMDSFRELQYVNTKIGNSDICEWNQSISIMKNESINFHESIIAHINMIAYASDENSDKETSEWIKNILGLYNHIAGDYEIRLVGVKFNEHIDKFYDYICLMDNIKEGDKIVVQGNKTEVETKAFYVIYQDIKSLKLPFDKYKEVIDVVYNRHQK